MSEDAAGTTGPVEERAFQTEVQQVLNLLIHSLYTHKEIFLRELISNASDALDKVHYRSLTDKSVLDAEAERYIDIRISKESKTLTIRDTGIGMTRDEVHQNIGTIAHSGSMDFVRQLAAAREKGTTEQLKLIGQFGVGFYSVFMVADRVVLTTRSADQGAEAVMWESTGDGKYTVSAADKAERGTEIKIYVRSDSEEYLDAHRLESIIRRHSDFVAYPIRVAGKQVNNTAAMWVRPRNEITEEQYNEFYTHLTGDTEPPLAREHVMVDVPIQFYAILYIPKHAPLQWLFSHEPRIAVNLHVRRVFIQDDCKELLPMYLRFVRGVVDCDDLPLNVSREALQHSPVMAKVRSTLVRRVLGMLESMSKRDEEEYLKFWRAYGMVLKEGIATDHENRDRLAALLRFHSSLEDDRQAFVSLQTGVDRMQADQKKIYYLTGDSVDGMAQSPLLETFRKRGLEVLLLDEAVDEWVVSSLQKFADKEFQAIDAADLELGDTGPKIEGVREEGREQTIELVSFLQKQLVDRVGDVRESSRLTDSPCVLVTPQGGLSHNMERLLRLSDREYAPTKRILEINPRHPIVRNLARMLSRERDSERLKEWAHLLVDYVLLGEGTVEDAQRVTRLLSSVMESATEYAGAAPPES
jgi:molecular chaperone HtpG